jgi:hypothetical protein
MCVLHASGKDFDPDSYLASAPFTAYRVFHVGEPRLTHRDGGHFEGSGFSAIVSEASWTDVKGQVEDAIGFLKNHQVSLADLRSRPELDDLRLDFPIELRIGVNNVAAQFDYFPPELVSRAGALGIGLEISIYPRTRETTNSSEPDEMDGVK